MGQIQILLAVNPFFQAFQESDLFGKAIFFLLFSLSILSCSLIAQKLWLFFLIRKACDSFEKAVEAKGSSLVLQKPLLLNTTPFHPYSEIYTTVQEKTKEILEKNRFFLQKDLTETVFLSSADIDLLESSLFRIIAKNGKRLEKQLFLLPTIVTLAPFVGLLGTVWGILTTFASFKAGALLHASSSVLSGLALALTTTILGLVIAIPALIASSYLKNSYKGFIKDMESFASNILHHVELQYRTVNLE